MFYSLTGYVKRVDDNVIVVNVNGVGYEVVCSFQSIEELTADQDEKTVYTYLQVREDGVCLYGFSSLEEKRMFLNLISVSGIGPKMAVTILSGVSSRMLASSIARSDISLLTKIKGLGKKTAERLVLELKEKISENIKFGESGVDGFENVKTETIVDFTNEMSDAVAILTELGIKKEEALKMVKSKAEKGDKADQIVRKCL